MHQPLTYTITEYEGNDESKVVRKQTYAGDKKEEAVDEFARAIGF